MADDSSRMQALSQGHNRWKDSAHSAPQSSSLLDSTSMTAAPGAPTSSSMQLMGLYPPPPALDGDLLRSLSATSFGDLLMPPNTVHQSPIFSLRRASPNIAGEFPPQLHSLRSMGLHQLRPGDSESCASGSSGDAGVATNSAPLWNQVFNHSVPTAAPVADVSPMSAGASYGKVSLYDPARMRALMSNASSSGHASVGHDWGGNPVGMEQLRAPPRLDIPISTGGAGDIHPHAFNVTHAHNAVQHYQQARSMMHGVPCNGHLSERSRESGVMPLCTCNPSPTITSGASPHALSVTTRFKRASAGGHVLEVPHHGVVTASSELLWPLHPPSQSSDAIGNGNQQITVEEEAARGRRGKRRRSEPLRSAAEPVTRARVLEAITVPSPDNTIIPSSRAPLAAPVSDAAPDGRQAGDGTRNAPHGKRRNVRSGAPPSGRWTALHKRRPTPVRKQDIASHEVVSEGAALCAAAAQSSGLAAMPPSPLWATSDTRESSAHVHTASGADVAEVSAHGMDESSAVLSSSDGECTASVMQLTRRSTATSSAGAISSIKTQTRRKLAAGAFGSASKEDLEAVYAMAREQLGSAAGKYPGHILLLTGNLQLICEEMLHTRLRSMATTPLPSSGRGGKRARTMVRTHPERNHERMVIGAYSLYPCTDGAPCTSTRARRIELWSAKRLRANWDKEAQVRYPHRAELVARRSRDGGRFQ